MILMKTWLKKKLLRKLLVLVVRRKLLKLLLLLLKLLQLKLLRLKNQKLNQLNNFTVILIDIDVYKRQREVKRAKLVAKYAERRAALKQIVRTGDPADAFEAAQKLMPVPAGPNAMVI